MKKENSIGEIVAMDFRAASIFKAAGIDFCCGGKMTIEEACNDKGIDQAEVEIKLAGLESEPEDTAHNFIEWDPGFLCDYIMNTHHRFVLKSLPELVQYTEKIARVHGDNHPELKEVSGLFAEINRELLQHLKNEEENLFPAIKEFLKSGSVKAKATIKTQIARLSAEHDFAGGAMDKINIITKGYAVPADGCNTYQVTFRLLEQFEDDLHVHVHLENNILFPKALKSVN
ncbi:MAG: iron-sulfur cluster repair di-iron protein [Bacteroidales bacterium]|nr:iron-sulfur cluster repair di-iron protein [Bacteroidales bacterium]